MPIVPDPAPTSVSRRLAMVAVLITAVGTAVTVPAHAQTTQRMDADFARRVAEWTTRSEFLSPLVDHLPLADGVPPRATSLATTSARHAN